MVCPQCKQMNADNVNFCMTCGQKLTPVDTQVSGARPTPMPLNADPTSQPVAPPSPGYGMQPPPYAPPGASPPTYTPYSPPGGPQPLTGVSVPPPPPGNMPGYAAPTVAYAGACRVCGNPLTASDYKCPRCATPVGMVVNPNDPTSNSYMPVGGPAYFENTSGQGGPVPLEIANMKWNWGAFGMNWIWLFAHRMIGWGFALLFLHLIPLFALIASIFIASNGNKYAWENRRYESIEHFKKVEGVWAIWGVIGFLVYLAIFCIYVASVAARVAANPGFAH